MPFDEPIRDVAPTINKESSNQPDPFWGGDISEDSNSVLRTQPFAADGLHPMTIVGGDRDQLQPVSNQAVFNDPRLQIAYLLQELQGSSYPFGNASTQVPIIDENIPPPPVPGDVIGLPVDSTNAPLPSTQTDAVQTAIDNMNAKGGADINGSGNANTGGGAVDNNDGSNNGGGNNGGGNNGDGGNNGNNRNNQFGGLSRLLSLGVGIGIISSLFSRSGGLGGGGAMSGLMAFSMIGSLLSRGLSGGGGLMNSSGGYNNPNSSYNGGYNNYNSDFGLSPYGIGNSGLFSIFGRR